MKDLSDSQPPGLYEAAIGEKNQDYYVAKFEDFDRLGPGYHASWNWAAFFFTGFWALYRRMYAWFFAWWFVATFSGILYKSPDSQLVNAVSYICLVLWLGFSALANSLYHGKTKARIAAAQRGNPDIEGVSRRLRAGGGVHSWVPIVFGAIPVVGIVAAVALPAYQDYTRRQASAPNPYAQTPNARSKVDEFLDAPAAPRNPFADPNFGKTDGPKDSGQKPWEEYQDAKYAEGLAFFKLRDYASSLSAFRPLAAQGYAAAQVSLGAMHYGGLGVLQDYEEAARWFQLAAAQGNEYALNQLGVMHAMGEGVPQDNIRAHMWLNLGAASGSDAAKRSRDEVARRMTPEQIAQALQMARDCQRRLFKGCG